MIDLYYQRQNVALAPGTLVLVVVYTDIRGSSLERGLKTARASDSSSMLDYVARYKFLYVCMYVNESGVVENGDFRCFRSPYLPNFHIQALQGHSYYVKATVTMLHYKLQIYCM